ncbi:MAG: hypothetical protein JXA08_04975 [Methanomicrobiaceae archaeon]|nr:hypothetical protein [Methanomicrobiaceae archaeon]
MSAEDRSGLQPVRNTLLWLGAGFLLLAAIGVVFLAAPGSTPALPPAPEPGVPIPSLPPVQATASPDPSPPVTVPPTLSPLPTSSATPGAVPSFTFTVTPEETQASPGDRVEYRLDIIPEGGFAAPIVLKLEIRALFIGEQYDLGTLNPPYPRSQIYPFIIPDTLPSGITLEGTLRTEGGGIVREADLLLHVR